jgi:multidrug efflux system membrane fusion protein
LAVAVVAVVLCGVFGWRYFYGADAATGDRNKAASAPAPIPVTVAQVQKADFAVYLNGLGAVEPYQTVLIRSRVDGAIVKIAFKQGQMVKQGDVLAQVDPRPYQAALDQALAKKTQDEATLRDARLNLQRYADLAKNDSVSRQTYDTQQATVDQLIAQIKGDQAIIDNAQTQFDYTTIRSPLTGKTGFRQVDAGNIVHAVDTTGIVTIVQLQPISVVFTAPKEDVP